MGVLLGNSNQDSEAIEHFRLATRLDPDYARAHINLGRMLADTQNVEEAIREMEQAVQLEPKRADLQCELGMLLGKNQQNEAAVEHFQSALTLDPNFAQAYFNLAASLALLNRPTEAIAAYERSIEVARSTGQQDLAKSAVERLAHYRDELRQADPKPR
jgi:Flp pilus assembly protein TadD